MKTILLIILSFISLPGEKDIVFEKPQNYAVYQRQADNTALVPIMISNVSKIKIFSWRLQSENVWQNLPFQRNGNRITASLRLHAGGWYRLEFRFEKSNGEVIETAIDHVGIGEVFITAGQSNAANWGKPKQRTRTGMVVVFDGKRWQAANDPLPLCDGKSGSIWSLVGDRLNKALNMPIGFMCLGVGGSGVRQWNPENYRNKVKNAQLYGRFKKYVPLLRPYGFRAVLWHQGETDRMSRKDVYVRNLKNVITGFKQDFGLAPWMVAIVGNQWFNPIYGKGCRAAQKQIIAEGLAFQGPDTDILGKKFRLMEGKSSHFNQRGLEAHAALWSKAIRRFLCQSKKH
ncbi:MAG: hypothetical protein JKX85_15630 [Phycisphaeraceae bacterium]|nr:hypothetical protein [Phycisphaeraceae bacterium]